MKRSRKTALLLMSAAPLWLSACHGEPDAREGVYTSVEACVSATNDRSTCQQAFDKARQQSGEQAPRYASQQQCTQDWGQERCEQRSESGGHSFFMPMMTGFMLSQMMRGGTPMSGFTSGPAYQDPRGAWQRPTPGAAPGATPGAATGAAAGGIYRTPGTSGMTPVTQPVNRAVTVSRGGFGRASGGRGLGS